MLWFAASLRYDVQPCLKQPGAERFAAGSIGMIRILAEKLQVLAIVEQIEELFVYTGPGQSRVPRPTICQNLDFERTILKNTRLTTSGTSMPVSSISTEMAMCGALS